MPLAGSMIKTWYHCRFKREMHSTQLWSRNFYSKLSRLTRLPAKL